MASRLRADLRTQACDVAVRYLKRTSAGVHGRNERAVVTARLQRRCSDEPRRRPLRVELSAYLASACIGPRRRPDTKVQGEPRATKVSALPWRITAAWAAVDMLARLAHGVTLLALAVYAPGAAGQAPLPAGVQLVHSGGECLSDDVDLGTFATLSECADACVASISGECNFFIYGTCTSSWGCGGNCHREGTSDASCPEGWEAKSYNFYSMTPSPPPPPPLPAGVQLVHSGGECLSDDVDLGTFATLSECADACVASPFGECNFFIYGTCTSSWGCGGNCHREGTSDASCPEGWEAKSYNFYSIDRPWSPPP
eukprot:COSAG02_NODE_14623_length_1253_cov_2.007799_2_plen_312_part_01